MIDYDQIAAEISPEELAQVLGAERVGAGWRCPSPDHNDRDPSFSVFRDGDRTAGKCHSCGLGGSPVSLASAVWGMAPRDAASRLVRELGMSVVSNGNGTRPAIVDRYPYVSADGTQVGRVIRSAPKDFRQQHRCPEAADGWTWGLGGNPKRCTCEKVVLPLYRLPEVLGSAEAVVVVEGEKDADRLAALGITATTCSGGAGKWRPEYSEALRGRVAIIIPDNDEPGREHAQQVARSLYGVAKTVKIVELPDLPPGGDVSDWLDAGGSAAELTQRAHEALVWNPEDAGPMRRSSASLRAGRNGLPQAPDHPVGGTVTLEDFWAYAPEHKFIFRPTREMWPASSVDTRLPRVKVDDGEIKASQWLDQNRSVEQLTWLPGAPEVIQDRVVSHGGFIDRPGIRCFNLYRPPTIELGAPEQAGLWVNHVHRLFAAEGSHLISWLAHRVQRPHEKVNHAIVLIGPQGVGKDTIITGAIPAVGHWNTWEVGPEELMGRFNPHRKSVILRVSEARDLGDTDRYRLYEHMKTLTAAPPEVLQVDEKNVRQYMIPNLVGVVITSNHTDGIYLPADDRRHFVAATELTKDAFPAAYWSELYRWYAGDGFRHVAAYLHSIDLSNFNPKAPPPKTPAFWKVVDAGRAPEDAELADVLDRLQWPEAITVADLIRAAERLDGDFADWLRERRNRRRIPQRLEGAGYVSIRNDGAQDGRWKVGGRNQMIYAKRSLSVRDRLAATARLVECSR